MDCYSLTKRIVLLISSSYIGHKFGEGGQELHRKDWMEKEEGHKMSSSFRLMCLSTWLPAGGTILEDCGCSFIKWNLTKGWGYWFHPSGGCRPQLSLLQRPGLVCHLTPLCCSYRATCFYVSPLWWSIPFQTMCQNKILYLLGFICFSLPGWKLFI